MINLAAVKYRHVLAESGGPIARIVSTPVSVYGRNTFQANAFLTPGLAPRKPDSDPFGIADGTGFSDSPQVAGNIATSKAIERWAFHTAAAWPNARQYGIAEDGTTSGMAAFPGLLKSQSRRRARLEALERLAVISWWDGRTSAIPADSGITGIHVLRVHHPADFGEVVIVYRKSKSGHISYGHAADTSVAGATARAIIELSQNEFVVTCHKLRGHGKPVSDFFERRCLHFAGPDGYQEFLAKIGTAPAKPAPSWDAVFDGELVGPWSKYATVWRTALKMPTEDFLDSEQNFFFWCRSN